MIGPLLGAWLVGRLGFGGAAAVWALALGLVIPAVACCGNPRRVASQAGMAALPQHVDGGAQPLALAKEEGAE